MIGPKSSGLHGRKHHDRPAGLAIADDRRLALGFRMQRDHALEKGGLGARDVLDRLPGHGIGQEADEVAGVAGLEGDADLALRLEAANAGPMPGARIDDDERTLILIRFLALLGDDAHKRIVHRPRELAPIHDELAAELQHMRRGFGGMLLIALAALLEDIEEEDAALPGVNPIVPCIPSQIDGRQGACIVTVCNRRVGHTQLLKKTAFLQWWLRYADFGENQDRKRATPDAVRLHISEAEIFECETPIVICCEL